MTFSGAQNLSSTMTKMKKMKKMEKEKKYCVDDDENSDSCEEEKPFERHQQRSNKDLEDGKGQCKRDDERNPLKKDGKSRFE